MYGPYDRWQHISCFAEKREDLEYHDSGEKMAGFMTLSADDQSDIKSKLPQMYVYILYWSLIVFYNSIP